MTGLVVSYNTYELLKRSIESVLKFHSSLPLLIIDGSDKGNLCYDYVQSLKSEQIHILQPGKNIGHGLGMNLGIRMIQTQYTLIFDSDIVILKSPVSQMLSMMEPDTFGCGWVTEIGTDGYDWGTFPHQIGPVKYLHPYFQLINISNYKKFASYTHHGAPCYKTMIDIYNKGLSSKILKHFSGLTGHTNGKGANWIGRPSEYIQHDFGGTRIANKASGKKEIIGQWDRS
jgi:glycosyltransferase involved in cell wall biosynthesis